MAHPFAFFAKGWDLSNEFPQPIRIPLSNSLKQCNSSAILLRVTSIFYSNSFPASFPPPLAFNCRLSTLNCLSNSFICHSYALPKTGARRNSPEINTIRTLCKNNEGGWGQRCSFLKPALELRPPSDSAPLTEPLFPHASVASHQSLCLFFSAVPKIPPATRAESAVPKHRTSSPLESAVTRKPGGGGHSVYLPRPSRSLLRSYRSGIFLKPGLSPSRIS